MTTEELVISKFRELNPEEQQRVWEFINTLPKLRTSELPKSANFELHFGALSLPNGTSIDNESIDADLAKEYSNAHEGE